MLLIIEIKSERQMS